MSDKVLLVVNPVAGVKGNVKSDVQIIEKNLKESGFEVTTEYTTIERNGKAIIEEKLEDNKTVIAVGGDGTLNEVVSGISDQEKDVRVGFIPYGTTNDFARTLNVPTDKFKLSKKITESKIQKCDTGTFNGKYFNYVSAFGVFAETSVTTKRNMKNKFGRLAYLDRGTKDFIAKKEAKIHLKITTDNEVIEDDFEYGSISNSKYIGGFQMFKDNEFDIDDGKFEVILIKKTRNKAALLGTYAKLIMQVRDENVICLQTSKLKIETNEKMQWSLDGELEETNGNIEIKNLKDNLSILTI